MIDLTVGDCRDVMADWDDDCIDAIVCDPPYELGFMGKSWDRSGVAFLPETWEAALRVIKPGGHLLAFGGTRTFHRLAVAIEDGGFEIRDCLSWLYGTGFPKSQDVSKMFDKKAGVVREIVGVKPGHEGFANRTTTGHLGGTSTAFKEGFNRPWMEDDEARAQYHGLTEPVTDLAKQWDGWGTALKPAWEPIILARKPLIGTVIQNVERHGNGAINIAATRLEGTKGTPASPRRAAQNTAYGDLSKDPGTGSGWDADVGRWPANVVLDDEAAEILDEQAGERKSGVPGVKHGGNNGPAYGTESRPPGTPMFGYGDSGGVSRFFYCAKSSRSERNAGLDEMPKRGGELRDAGRFNSGGRSLVGGEWQETNSSPRPKANHHPTVKPISLMRWLIKLITPPGGTILDPFLGSGSTGCAVAIENVVLQAALMEEFDFVGIDLSAEYVAIARARIEHWMKS